MGVPFSMFRGRGGMRAPSRPAPGGSVVPSSVSPSARYVDSVVREIAITAADTWTSMTEYMSVSEGDINVPTQARYLSGLQIAMAVEQAAAVSNKLASVVRLSGAALAQGGRYHFLGPYGTAVILSANGSNCNHAQGVEYPLAIPVKGGDQLKVEAMSFGDDPTDWFFGAALTFSDQPAPGGFVDGDVREADIAATDTDTSLTNIGGDALGHFRVPTGRSKLACLATAMSYDPGVSAAVLKLASTFHLRGDALAYGGSFRLLGSWGGFDAAGTPVGGQLTILPPELHRIELELVPGNTLEGHAVMLAEDCGDVNAALGVLYA